MIYFNVFGVCFKWAVHEHINSIVISKTIIASEKFMEV